MKTSKIIIVSMAGLFILMLVVGLLMLKSYVKSTRHNRGVMGMQQLLK